MAGGRPHTARAALMVLLLAAPVALPLGLRDASASAAVDGAVVYVDPYYPAAGLPTLMTVRPLTLVDGAEYYAFTVRVRERDVLSNAWVYRDLDPADTWVRARPIGGDGPWYGGASDSFAYAGDRTRVLVTIPKSAAPDGLADVQGRSRGYEGSYNLRKEFVSPDVADALDVTPTPVEFSAASAGSLKFSVSLEIVPVDASSYRVTVTPLSPFLEGTLLSTPHGQRDLTLDSTAPGDFAFAGDPVGVVARTEATRFSLASRVSFGDPVARFLLCKTAVPCLTSVTKVLTRENVTADGGFSYSPPGELLTYRWTFGDGSVLRGSPARYDWKTPGSYLLTLTVTDESSRSASATLPVIALNRAPTGVVSVSPSPANRVDATVLSVAWTDLDGTVVQFSWTVDGASTPHDTGASSLTLPAGTLGLGAHSARVLMKDNSGAFGSATLAFEVVNLLPTVLGSSDRRYVQPDQAVQFRDASTDREGPIAARQWTFGDGAGSTAQDPVHAYAAEGVYTPRLVVTDGDGASVAQVLPTITVDGTRPTLQATFPAPPPSGWHQAAVTVPVSTSDDRDPSPILTVTSNGNPLTVTNGRFSVNTDGRNEVLVVTTDWAGNERRIESVVNIDRSAPNVRLLNEPYPWATGKEQLRFRVTDSASGAARAEFYVNGVLRAAADDPPADWVVEWDTSSRPVGEYVLTVKARDRAGLSSTFSWKVYALNTPLGPVPPP